MVPDSTARALVGDNSFTGQGVDLEDGGNAEALAHALAVGPHVVNFASLGVAGALALLGIPVVGVIDASLRGADPVAALGVPGVHNTSGAVSVGSLEGADAGLSFLIPVVVGVLADVADSEFAVVHVPVSAGGGLSGSEATARAGRGVEEVALVASLVVALAAAGHGVPGVANSAQLFDAAALADLKVPVETNWASAVFGEALAGSGVEVLTEGAVEGAAQAAAGEVVEVLVGSASVLGVLSADAGADLGVVGGVDELARAVLGQASAAAVLAVPVEAFIAGVDASGGRADAVANVLAPVVAISAVVGLAEAAAVVRVLNVGSPVLGQRAHAWQADALAVLVAPVEAWAAGLGPADALADLRVVDEACGAGRPWLEASATTFFRIEIIIIIYVVRFGSCAVWKNVAVAAAMLLAPVVAGGALDWLALAFAVLAVPVEVVRADLGAAFASAERLVENLVGSALGGRAHALAELDIKVLAWGALVLNAGVALAAASVSVPDVVTIAGLRNWLLAEAAAHAGVEVVGIVALVGLAEAAASQRVEVRAAGAVLVLADAVTDILSNELVAGGAHQGFADAAARGLVPDVVAAAFLNDAFEIAGGDIPGVPFGLGGVDLGLTDALAASLIPDYVVAKGVGALAVMSALALARAVVVIPEVVIGAWPSHTQAFSGKCVELFPLVVAVLHFISAGAV